MTDTEHVLRSCFLPLMLAVCFSNTEAAKAEKPTDARNANSIEAKRLPGLRDELAGRTKEKNFGSNAYEAEVIHIVHDLIELTRSSKETE